MRRLRSHWLQALLAACALITLALLLIPGWRDAPVPPPSEPRYAGGDFQARPASRLSAFILSLSGAADTAPSPVNAQPLPTLVGLAGRSAYLRGASSGATERISVGGEFEGWRVIAIGVRAVTLRGPAGDKRLELFALPAADGGEETGGESVE